MPIPWPRGPLRGVSTGVSDIIGAVASEEHIRSVLRTVWHVTADECAPLAGMPDSWWSVTIGTERHVVRTAPESRRSRLLAALTVTEALGGAGVAVGRPVRTADGALTATTPTGDIALLAGVIGRPLDATNPLDQLWWGDLLGRAHRALLPHQRLVSERLVMPQVNAPHLGVADWLRPTLGDVVQAVSRLMVTDQLTYGILHGEPGPDAFRLDVRTGATGLTGWGPPVLGPLVYDVAVAVRHAGGPDAAEELLDGYASAGPVDPDELAVALPVLLRLHWALVADAHARALAGATATVPLPRASAMAVAARRDALEEARSALADLSHQSSAE